MESTSFEEKNKREDELVKLVKTVINFEIPTSSDLIQAVIAGMQYVGKFTDLRGTEKKAMVLKAIDVVLALIKEKHPNMATDLLALSLPVIIDNLIDVEKNKLVFNKQISNTVKSKTSNCCI